MLFRTSLIAHAVDILESWVKPKFDKTDQEHKKTESFLLYVKQKVRLGDSKEQQIEAVRLQDFLTDLEVERKVQEK